MKSFNYHIVLPRSDLCNYQKEIKILTQQILRGQKIIIYGRRNTGKTSIVLSALVPEYRKKVKDGLVVYADFMGVKSLHQIGDRIRTAFQTGICETYPKKALFQKTLDLLKTVRPTLSVDPVTGSINLTLSSTQGKADPDLETLLFEVDRIHQKSGALIIFDEFQDIHKIDQAEGRLRGVLQRLSVDLPIVILGSKKHMLAEIFAAPKAPFAGWGMPLDIPRIAPSEYCGYINERFQPFGLEIDVDITEYLMSRMDFIPECINIVCHVMTDFLSNKLLKREDIEKSISLAASKFRTHYSEIIARLTEAESEVLIAIAKNQPVRSVQNREFLQNVKSSSSGVRKITKKLEDEGLIYREEHTLLLSDPLMVSYIRDFH